MTIPRVVLPQLQKDLGKNKVLVITGARRVGKTFLLKELLAGYNEKYVHLNGDLPESTQLLQSKNLTAYKGIIGESKLLLIDEA